LVESTEKDEFGRKKPSASIFEISQLFTKFGDINVIKVNELSCYIEFQDFDPSLVPKSQESKTVGEQVVYLVKKEMT
jgi:hypothetical protein